MLVNIEKVLMRKESFERENEITTPKADVTMAVKISANTEKDIVIINIGITGIGDGKKIFSLSGEYIIYYNPDDEFKSLDIKDKGNEVFKEAYNTDLRDRFKAAFKKAELSSIDLPDI